MNKPSPVVAEIGRPETPEETAARKAAFSKTYRASQNVRNLVAALLVTVAVVAVIYFAVPRGTPVPVDQPDVVAIAAEVESAMGSPALLPEIDDSWRVNAAALKGGAVPVWRITLAPSAQDARGFVHIAQAFDADSSWAPQQLQGVAPTETTVVDGRTWDVFKLGDTNKQANITYAMGTQAGEDYILLYGALSSEDTAALAATLAPQLDIIAEAK